MHPKLKIQLNKKLDLQTCFNFINYKYAGVDFGEGIAFFHKKLKEIRELPKIKFRKETIDYIDNFYKKNDNTLKHVQKDFLNRWSRIAEKFFINTDKIFNNYKWPKGKYICYLSIFPCNPRFLNDKIFQVFYKDEKDANRIICHEMLHFIFYSYWNKYVKKNKIKINDDQLWEVSEIFNVLVLNRKEFKTIIKPSKEYGYPEHKNKITIIKNVLKCDWNIDCFLSEILKLK